MVWCSGYKLAAAVSNAGGLGLIGAGSMYPDVFREHLRKCKKATTKPFGVNIPLLYPQTDELVQIVIEEGVNIVFTSAGNPKKYTSTLKKHGIKVVHVVANLKFAKKCVEAGVDAIVAEGVEAGGHNGIEETTTLSLVPFIKQHIEIPIIAAGGIASGKAMLAALALGADGVQVGSAFAVAEESSAHENFKQKVVDIREGETSLALKQHVPVRLIHNAFYQRVRKAELDGASKEELIEILGKGRAKLGMFEGNLDEGELEIGQVSAQIDKVQPAAVILQSIIDEYRQERIRIASDDYAFPKTVNS